MGTMNVLEATRACGARRVVVMSSISAKMSNPGWEKGRVMDKECWADHDYCKERKKWYPVSKTLAEKIAWEYAEKYNMDIVVINPSTCLGLLLHCSQCQFCNPPTTITRVEGHAAISLYHWLGCIHVRDVAAAQVLLLETPSASGRHLCTHGICQFKDFSETVNCV